MKRIRQKTKYHIAIENYRRARNEAYKEEKAAMQRDSVRVKVDGDVDVVQCSILCMTHKNYCIKLGIRNIL